METENKVFVSNIIRSKNTLKNNLKDIYNIVPAVPVKNTCHNNTKTDCNFVPRSDKHYVPKKRFSTKVKTVKDIRKVFESDVFTYLSADLERQKNLLLRKIRGGTAKDEKTKELAKNILDSPDPISRSAWQMIMNINPEEHMFPIQHVLWNDRSIQLNGSKGGRNKFICNYDIAKVKGDTSQTKIKQEILPRKRSLLQYSLDVKFKPGPLSKKQRLDDSYQKYQFGDMDLVNLPKPGLDIQPSFGKPLAPAINTFIHHTFLLPAEGVISQKWADFSVSVVGTLKNGTPVPVAEVSNITFDLDYKCFQRRLLMRHDSDKEQHIRISNDEYNNTEDALTITSEVSTIMNKILDSVEISLKQDDIYSGSDELRDIDNLKNTSNTNSVNQIKDKVKRKFGELDRLDVTVITIEESTNSKNNGSCLNSHCRLGCVCDSLKSSYIFKRHCGKVECMFKCKCDFSKYKITDSFDDDCSDIIPGLINLDKKLGQTLAKEEHKFHQTVVVTNEKSILLKSQRRNWKTSKKYAEFYSNMQLKAINRNKQSLSVVCKRIDLENVEPWCMVHNLYKCFCKGRFTELHFEGALATNIVNPLNVLDKSEKSCESIDSNNDTPINKIKASLRIRPESCVATDNKEISVSPFVSLPLDNTSSDSVDLFKCARTLCYEGRKYTEEYYQATNQKILDMERNDEKLHRKMIALMKKCNEFYSDGEDSQNVDNVDASPSLNDLLSSVINQNSQGPVEDIAKPDTFEKLTPSNLKHVSNKESLVTWLESNYKFYKDQTVVDPIKTGLHPPKYGKIALYPWNFILSRYRDRKNLFLISKQKPFRIFMAVNKKHPYFNNCIDISDIALSDIDKYPNTIKNLLTNATETKDNFYILYGLSFCWELIGSVTKVNENLREKENTIDSENLEKVSKPEQISENKDISDPDCVIVHADNISKQEGEIMHFTNEEPEMSSKQSKWFLMTIENDFSEIQFFKKGFFVKYQNLIKATSVARRLGKTVRLSSQQCNTNNPQFGIYAIPSNQNNYVFIGPYEKDDTLGIETVKTKTDTRKGQCTRGTWITTNKIDNFKVIDNPLLYIPSSKVNNEKMIAFESNPKTTCEIINTNHTELTVDNIDDKHTQPSVSTEKSPKILKPIRIQKSNNFRLGILKQNPLLVTNKSLIINKSSSRGYKFNQKVQSFSKIKSLSQICKAIVMPKSVVQEIASQKETFNLASTSTAQKKKHEGGMFVLKPEEINKRSLENGLSSVSQPAIEQDKICETTMDIENFLSKTNICVPPQTDVFVISDDEDDMETTELWKEVWIVCKNIPNLGWIPGRQNATNQLSFEFPGFTYTAFYAQEEAFSKINEVIARKVYVPKHICVQWRVVESTTDLEIGNKLQSKNLNSEYVLTRKGLVHKRNLIEKLKSINNLSSPTKTIEEKESVNIDSNSKVSIIGHLEETSQTLNDESVFLLEKAIANKKEIIESFSKTSDEVRKTLIEQINKIKTDTEEL